MGKIYIVESDDDDEEYCNKCKKKFLFNHTHCPKCDSPPSRHELRNYDMAWHDGDVYCLDCDKRVRTWDAG